MTKRLPRNADGLRRHDFVGLLVLEYPVLMNAGLMGKGIVADDRFVDRNRNAGYLRHQARCRIKLFTVMMLVSRSR